MVTNLSEEEKNGTVRLSLSDASTGQSLDNEFLIGNTDQSFSVPAKSSRSYYWEVEVPDYTGVLTHKVVASTGKLSDGSESQAKKRVGLLFDEDHMEASLSSAYYKLAQMQLSNGAWPWFPGRSSNFYMTLYIMTGFGRLQHLNIGVEQDLVVKCLDYMDNSIFAGAGLYGGFISVDVHL